MDRDYDKEIIEDDVTRIVRQAFGVDEDQLLRDFLLAQTEIKDDQIPPEPVDGFEQLLKKMKERGIRPKYIHADSDIIRISAEETAAAAAGSMVSDSGDASADEAVRSIGEIRTCKPRRLRTIIKVAAIAAVLMAMVLGMGITARARKRYTFNVTERDLAGVDILYDKGNVTSQEDMLEEAYQRIYDELGINVLKLNYIPKGMLFEKLSISKNRAKLHFYYNEKYVYVTQQLRIEGSSFNTVTDRKPYKSIYNMWFAQEIPIEMNEIKNGNKEFHIQITEQESYYSIEGIIPEDEFEKIVENIYLEIKDNRRIGQ